MPNEDGKDIFLLPDGRVYHLGLLREDFSNRILTVGCHFRAKRLADQYLTNCTEIISDRGFYTYTGYKGKTKVSIIAIGMGTPNMDIFLREIFYLMDGCTAAIVRLGSCGFLLPNVEPGCFFLSDKSFYCFKNYAHFDGSALKDQNTTSPYIISGPVAADTLLTEIIEKKINMECINFKKGPNLSAETFFACQGRQLSDFLDDENEKVVFEFEKLKVNSLEMETYYLLHACNHRGNPPPPHTESSSTKQTKHITTNKTSKVTTRAAAIHIGICNRVDPQFSGHLPADVRDKLLSDCGGAVLDALTEVPL